jgi:hypothetical protein
MFYCEKCRIEKGWPESYSRSTGRCECCNEKTICHDVPSKHLPLPKPDLTKIKAEEIANRIEFNENIY